MFILSFMTNIKGEKSMRGVVFLSTNTMTGNETLMETPTPFTTLINALAEQWKAITILFGGLALLWGYFKVLRGKGRAVIAWFRKAAQTPDAVQDIKEELMLDGKPLRKAVIDLGADLKNLTLFLNAETKWRRAILDSIDEPIFEADKDGMFMWANQKMLDVTDMDMHQIVGNNWPNFITGRDRRNTVEGFKTAVNDHADYRATFRIAGPGPDRWYLFDMVCNKDESGNVLNFIGKLKSITNGTTQVSELSNS